MYVNACTVHIQLYKRRSHMQGLAVACELLAQIVDLKFLKCRPKTLHYTAPILAVDENSFASLQSPREIR